MRKGELGGVFLMCLFLLLAGYAIAGSGTRDFLSEMSRELSNLETFTAEFEQRVPLSGTGVVREARGKMYFESGKGSRWDYTEPAIQTYLVLGDTVYYRDGEEGEFAPTRISSEALRLFQSLIGGDEPLVALFTQGRVKIVEKGIYEVELIPLGRVKRVAKRVVVTWDEKERVVKKIAVFGTAGLANLVIFRRVVKNGPVSPSLFELP